MTSKVFYKVRAILDETTKSILVQCKDRWFTRWYSWTSFEYYEGERPSRYCLSLEEATKRAKELVDRLAYSIIIYEKRGR